MKCKICSNNANVHLKYCGLKLCEAHFTKYLQNRVERTIKRYKMIRKNDEIAVALSGGKDSQTLLHILKQIYGDSNSIIGLHIDLGIENYSLESAKFVNILCEELKVPLHIINIQDEYNISIDKIKKSKKIHRPICSNCGIIKRYILNLFARKIGADVLATGHLLDDEAGVLLSNLVNGNFDQLIRGGPFLPSTDPTLITRVKPLYEISEYETILYAYFNKISHIETRCPYDVNATITSYKEIIRKMEELHPGAQYSFIRNYVKTYVKAFQAYNTNKEQAILHCKICGGPTTREICAFCSLKNKVEESTHD